MEIEALRDEIVNFTQELIRSNSLPGKESGVAAIVEQKMRSLDYDQVFVDENGSVVGRRKGGKAGQRILFDAHMDVVDVQNAASWSCDPFGGELRDGKIWGRGATDIKGGLAGMVIALGRLPRDEFAGELVVSASIGEEMIEGIAVEDIVRRTQPQGAVIVEPSDCLLGLGHKGRTGFWLRLDGKAAHTSEPGQGVNAIYKAMQAVERLRKISLPADRFLGTGIMELIEIISAPFPGECTVPYGCSLRFDRRLVGGETMESVLASIQYGLAGIEGWLAGFTENTLQTYTGRILKKTEFHPGWTVDPGSDWVRHALTGLEKVGVHTETMYAPYCTNASYTAAIAGLPTLVFGPSSIHLAHVVDEYIEIAELLRGARGLAGLAAELGHTIS
jgi:putative selenium metabolism hydrolase